MHSAELCNSSVPCFLSISKLPLWRHEYVCLIYFGFALFLLAGGCSRCRRSTGPLQPQHRPARATTRRRRSVARVAGTLLTRITTAAETTRSRKRCPKKHRRQQLQRRRRRQRVNMTMTTSHRGTWLTSSSRPRCARGSRSRKSCCCNSSTWPSSSSNWRTFSRCRHSCSRPRNSSSTCRC